MESSKIFVWTVMLRIELQSTFKNPCFKIKGVGIIFYLAETPFMLHDLNSTLKEVNLVDQMYGYAGFEFLSLDTQEFIRSFWYFKENRR